jgi:uncharacterized protein (DUF1330 family)
MSIFTKLKMKFGLKLLMAKSKRSKVKMNDTVPIYMLNALWFKPDGGHKKYKQYMAAVEPLLKKYNGRVHSNFYVPQNEIIGKFDADLIFFVKWPSWDIFNQFVSDPDYQDIMQIREKAITNSLLIRCAKM